MRQLYLSVNSIDGNYLGNRSRNVQNREEKKKKTQTEMISALKVPYWKTVSGNGCFTCAFLPSPREACSLVSLGHYSLLVQLE